MLLELEENLFKPKKVIIVDLIQQKIGLIIIEKKIVRKTFEMI